MAEFKPSRVTGAIDVSAQPASIIVVGNQPLVSAATETTIATMTANGFDHVTRISCSGDDYATWRLYINTVLVETKKANGYEVEFQWDNPLSLTSGNVLDVKVEHGLTGEQLSFDATIYGFNGV